MSLANMDRDYVECGKSHLKTWIKEYDAEKYRMSEETMEEFINIGGEGFRVLQKNFIKVLEKAKEENVEIIDKSYIEHVFKNE